MVTSFATVADALASRVKPVRLYCRVGGVAVDVWEAHCSHGVNQPIGTCSVVCGLPAPSSVVPGASIEIEAGYAGATARIFYGRIPNHDGAIDDSGGSLRIDGVGWASLLAYEDASAIEVEGPIELSELFKALCADRDIPNFLSDTTTDSSGDPIILASNELANNARVTIDTGTNPLARITRAAEAFGFRVFDSPDGMVRLARVSGYPPEAGDWEYIEGVNCYEMAHGTDTRPMVTYWEVIGARYTADDGGPTEIRSIPDEVPYSDYLAPLGYVKDTYSDSENIDTDTLAESCRNALEIDRGSLYLLPEWSAAGNPSLQPGDVVNLYSLSLGISDSLFWVTKITQDVTDDGYTMRCEGWSGGGVALAAGNDCLTTTIAGGPWHLGDETISWYDDPTPEAPITVDGETLYAVRITVTFTGDYSSLRLLGEAHGTNSYGTGLADHTTDGSVIEVWQLEDPTIAESASNEFRRLGSVDLPTLDERFKYHDAYATDDDAWTAFSLPLPGTVKTGDGELRIVAGENPGGRDDFELRNLRLVTCGVGQPTIVGRATS